VAAIHPDNAASRRVAEKCGLRFWKEATTEDAGPLQLYVLERAGGG
jgi:RimJ/RimL family protein N-acetyltransferase